MKINIGKLKPEHELHEHNLEKLFEEEIDAFFNPDEDEDKFGMTINHYRGSMNAKLYTECYFWGVTDADDPIKLQTYIVKKMLPEITFGGFKPDEEGQFILGRGHKEIFLQAAKDTNLWKSAGSDYSYVLFNNAADIIKFSKKVKELLAKVPKAKPVKKAVSKAPTKVKTAPAKIAAKAKKIVVKDLKPPTTKRGK